MRSLATAMAAILVMLAGPVHADVIALSDVADGWAYSTDNFATVGGVVSPSAILTVGKSGGFEERTALEFDISSLPPGASITSAVLQLWFTVLADVYVGVYGTTGNGTIESGDFTFDGPIATFDPTTTGVPTLNQIDVTSFIASMVGAHFVVFQLRELENDANYLVGGTTFPELASFTPRLVITTPAPSPLFLLASGLAALGGVAWRRRR